MLLQKVRSRLRRTTTFELWPLPGAPLETELGPPRHQHEPHGPKKVASCAGKTLIKFARSENGGPTAPITCALVQVKLQVSPKGTLSST